MDEAHEMELGHEAQGLMADAQREPTVFETWERRGVRYLAFQMAGNGSQFCVIDEYGHNYGSWLTVERFRQLQGIEADTTRPIEGCRVQLSGRVICDPQECAAHP